MTDLSREITNILEERISHGQNELYDAMKKLSDTELDRVFASSKLGTISHRQPELTWNHKNNIDGHGNFKYKSSRARMFFQGVWKHLKGRPVWDSWDRQLPASRFSFSMRVLTRHYKEGKNSILVFASVICLYLSLYQYQTSTLCYDRRAPLVCREATLKELLPDLVRWDSEPKAHWKTENYPWNRDIQIPVERGCG